MATMNIHAKKMYGPDGLESRLRVWRDGRSDQYCTVSLKADGIEVSLFIDQDQLQQLAKDILTMAVAWEEGALTQPSSGGRSEILPDFSLSTPTQLSLVLPKPTPLVVDGELIDEESDTPALEAALA